MTENCLRRHTIAGVEIQGVYDGVLFWACLACGATWNRWDPDKYSQRWARAEEHRARFKERRQHASVDPEAAVTQAVASAALEGHLLDDAWRGVLRGVAHGHAAADNVISAEVGEVQDER